LKNVTSTGQANDAFGHLVALLKHTIYEVLRINHWENVQKILRVFLTKGWVRTLRTLYVYATGVNVCGRERMQCIQL